MSEAAIEEIQQRIILLELGSSITQRARVSELKWALSLLEELPSEESGQQKEWTGREIRDIAELEYPATYNEGMIVMDDPMYVTKRLSFVDGFKKCLELSGLSKE